MQKERGAALIIAVIVMGLLAALIVGLSTNTDIDLLVGRNARILKQAFDWSDSGLELAKDLISISESDPGKEVDKLDFNNHTFGVSVSNSTYNATNATFVTLKDNDLNKDVSIVRISFLGSIVNDGSSIIFGAGYEGAGKGAGAGGTIARIYSLRSSGFSESNSTKRSAAIYRSVSSGM
jgi:hypothetical protein